MVELPPQEQKCYECYLGYKAKGYEYDSTCNLYMDFEEEGLNKTSMCVNLVVILSELEEKLKGNPYLTMPSIVEKIIENET